MTDNRLFNPENRLPDPAAMIVASRSILPQVLIHGQSAGGYAVFAHMLLPRYARTASHLLA